MSPLKGLSRFRRFAEGTPLFVVLEIRGERADTRFLDGRELANVRVRDERAQGLPWFPACVRDIRAFRVGQ